MTRPMPDCLVVQKLYVVPGQQGRGIGAWALRVALDEAKAAALPVRLTVLKTNPARKFYEREGFRLEGETTERWAMVTP